MLKRSSLSIFCLFLPWLVLAKPIPFIVAYENKLQHPYYLGEGEVIPPQPGYSVELLRKMAEKRPEIKLEFVRMPWKRCLSALEKGKVMGIFNASYKTDRLRNGVYPTKNNRPDSDLRIAVLSYSLYIQKNSSLNWDGQKFINLQGTIGGPLGYSIIDDLKSWGVETMETVSSRNGLQKLALGHIAGMAVQEFTGDFFLKQEEFKDLVKLTPPLITKNYYLMISHQFYDEYTALSQKIWKTLGEVRETHVTELFNKYTTIEN